MSDILEHPRLGALHLAAHLIAQRHLKTHPVVRGDLGAGLDRLPERDVDPAYLLGEKLDPDADVFADVLTQRVRDAFADGVDAVSQIGEHPQDHRGRLPHLIQSLRQRQLCRDLTLVGVHQKFERAVILTVVRLSSQHGVSHGNELRMQVARRLILGPERTYDMFEGLQGRRRVVHEGVDHAWSQLGRAVLEDRQLVLYERGVTDGFPDEWQTAENGHVSSPQFKARRFAASGWSRCTNRMSFWRSTPVAGSRHSPASS